MEIDWSEHYLRKGSPDEPTYYIIRSNISTRGLFCHFNVFAGRIKYALERGFVPVIDMQNFPNLYLPNELLGKENAWEYYFRQPLGIGLKTAYNGENVLLSEGQDLDFPNRPHAEVMRSFDNKPDGFLAQFRMLVKLGLLRIKPEIQAEIDVTYKKLFVPTDRVLGVFLRGTDYVARRPHAHAIPPPLEYALTHVVLKINEWQCNKIFLVTEDKEIVAAFKDFFGNFCVTTEKNYVNYDGQKGIGFYNSDRPNDKFLRGKEYLMDIAILAKLDYLVAARTNGSLGAMILKTDGYKDLLIFNFGLYNLISPQEFLT